MIDSFTVAVGLLCVFAGVSGVTILVMRHRILQFMRMRYEAVFREDDLSETARQAAARRALCVGALVAVVAAAGGCVPHPREPPAPFSLTVGPTGLEMTLCFGPATMTRLVVAVREHDGGGWSDWSEVLRTDDRMRAEFTAGVKFPLQTKMPSITYIVPPEFDLPEGESSIAVTFDYESDGHWHYNETFLSPSASDLAEGGHMYSDGTVNARPCDMDSAQ